MNTIEDFKVEDPDFLSRDEVIALHGRLKSIVARRGQLDAEEAKLLRIVEQGKAWKLFACVNQLDYMERARVPAAHRQRAHAGRTPACRPAAARGRAGRWRAAVHRDSRANARRGH